MDPMAEIRLTFFQECEEQLAALEAGLLTMDEGDTSSETVNAVFRAVHSIKGGAGAFKLGQLVEFAHLFETVLDRVRAGKLAPAGEVMRLLVRAADVLADLVAAARQARTVDAGARAGISGELAALLGETGTEDDAEDGAFTIDFAPVATTFDDLAMPPADAAPAFAINFKPHRGLFEKANEPLALIRELSRLGQLDITCDASQLPPIDGLDPGQPWLAWTARLFTSEGEAAIREVFEFVDGDCDLAIEPCQSATPGGEDPGPPPSEIPAVVDFPAEPPASLAAAPQPAPAGGNVVAMPPTIRVDLDRVDRLINLVGELVINQAMLSQRVHHSDHGRDAGVATSLDELEHLTRDLQESVMAIRAQPVKQLFQRMSRIVREVAEATGKMVRLRTEGESTEVDKTVLELQADPLTHMIRNAVDHGIEKPEDRAASGKPSEGTVKLSAAHRSGRVVIEVTDDGAGIDRKRVFDSAVRKGLVAEDAVLNDAEIDSLLFSPGFSTASAVSNICGRGVGMDVVKRSIQALGGRITTSSKPGEGSTFTMSLPLTLAVLDGIVVSILDQTFVIPLTAIVETLKLEADMLHVIGEGASVIHIRDRFVPLVDVGVELGVREAREAAPDGVAILVETEKGSRSALLVDGIQDQRQVVIKSLETNYDRVRGVAAATILGDGTVAMILDVDALVAGRTMDGPLPDPGANANFNLAKAG